MVEPRRAVFFDRDDTLMIDVPYLTDPERVQLFSETRDALLRLDEAGFFLAIVSNQSGIGRGLCTHEQVQSVNARLLELLAPIPISAVYYSPDSPDSPSQTRKPAPGMLFQARAEHGIDLARSFLVGDRASDLECARNAGSRGVWLRRNPEAPPLPIAPDFVAPDLLVAADWILSQP